MKKIISIVLSVTMLLLCFTGCSSVEMTEANVTKTIDKAFTALAEFNTKDLKKYVHSATLNTIIEYADKKEQFKTLGMAIFSNLEYEIKDIDLENQTATVIVKNKDLYNIAFDFAQEIKSDYTPLQLLNKINDDGFLNTYVTSLCNSINDAPLSDNEIIITLNIVQDKKNLSLSFDSTSEDAVSGGALSAIKAIYGME